MLINSNIAHKSSPKFQFLANFQYISSETGCRDQQKTTAPSLNYAHFPFPIFSEKKQLSFHGFCLGPCNEGKWLTQREHRSCKRSRRGELYVFSACLRSAIFDESYNFNLHEKRSFLFSPGPSGPLRQHHPI